MEDSQEQPNRRRKKRRTEKRKRIQLDLEMYERTTIPKKKLYTMSTVNESSSPKLPQFGSTDRYDSL